MTRMKVLGLAACMAWGGVAVTTATAVDARAATSQTGAFAAVSGWSVSEDNVFCGIGFNYRQKMRFVSQGCNSGGCSDDNNTGYSEFLYSQGRQQTTLSESCGDFETGGWHIYNFGSCSC